eukprot:gb/GEZN01024331.1/.p1 GENE.gb/GEZN01024331.1/~~gb/GEZN01024331.1/.p1  ORF type:complete len:103 (-),score=6.13 gb/GEZN01024331.1/:94-402(-)
MGTKASKSDEGAPPKHKRARAVTGDYSGSGPDTSATFVHVQQHDRTSTKPLTVKTKVCRTKAPLLVHRPLGDAPTDQGLVWARRSMLVDTDGDPAHGHLGPF